MILSFFLGACIKSKIANANISKTEGLVEPHAVANLQLIESMRTTQEKWSKQSAE